MCGLNFHSDIKVLFIKSKLVIRFGTLHRTNLFRKQNHTIYLPINFTLSLVFKTNAISKVSYFNHIE